MLIHHKLLYSLLLGGVLLTLGDVLMKVWALGNGKLYYLGGVLLWGAASIFLAWTYKHKNMASATIIYIMVNIITLAIISWVVFKEPLTTKQMLGLILGLAAITLS